MAEKFWLSLNTLSGSQGPYQNYIIGIPTSGIPIKCGHCPCVDGYAIFAFVQRNETSGGIINYCYNYVRAYPGGICNGKIYFSPQYYAHGGDQVQIPINTSITSPYQKVGNFDGCVWEVEEQPGQMTCWGWENISVYLLSPIFTDYDYFREYFFTPCSGDLSAFVFAGGKYPCHIPNVSRSGSYCVYQTWNDLAIETFDVKPYWKIDTKKFKIYINGGGYWLKQTDWEIYRWCCDGQHTEQGCTEWCEQRYPIKWDYYYGIYRIDDGDNNYFGKIGDSQQGIPEYVYSDTETWLAGGISLANDIITSKLQNLDQFSTQSSTSGLTNKCIDLSYVSNQQCIYDYTSYPCNYSRQMTWRYINITCQKHPNAPQAAIGIKSNIQWKKYDYSGENVTFSSGVIQKTFAWDQTYMLPLADNLQHLFNQHKCGDGDEGRARPGPCPSDYVNPYTKYEIKLVSKEYNFGD